MIASTFSNLFMADVNAPCKNSESKFVRMLCPDEDGRIYGHDGRLFIKDGFSTTIEGAMILAAKERGCNLDDVRYIYQLMDTNVRGVMYDVNESPFKASVNQVDIDVTDMVTDEMGSDELIRAVGLRPFCIAIPKILVRSADSPCTRSSSPELIDVPIFSVKLKPYNVYVYRTYARFETDKKCHRPEFLEYVVD